MAKIIVFFFITLYVCCYGKNLIIWYTVMSEYCPCLLHPDEISPGPGWQPSLKYSCRYFFDLRKIMSSTKILYKIYLIYGNHFFGQ